MPAVSAASPEILEKNAGPRELKPAVSVTGRWWIFFKKNGFYVGRVYRHRTFSRGTGNQFET